MSAHDDLLRLLRESVRERGAAPPSHRHALRRRRAFGSRRGLLVALIALVVGGGVAGAAQVGVLPVTLRGDHPPDARELAFQVVTETRDLPACRKYDNNVGATVRLARIAPAARGLITGPPDPAAEREALDYNHGGPVVAGSARSVRVGGAHVVLWLAVGNGSNSLADPAACAVARESQLARDRPDPTSRLRAKALALLRENRETLPGMQSLWLMKERPRSGWFGTGIPLDGRPEPVGLMFGGSDGEYVGIAAPGATRLTLTGRTLHRTTPVRDRFYAYRLPRGTGPVAVRHVTPAGRVVKTERVRG